MTRCPLFVLLAVSLLAAGTGLAQNVLVNSDFESNPPPNFGNNIGWSIAPWIRAGSRSNVVTVDGPGGYDYGTNGPESDASAPGAGIPQHYLDIANGTNYFYQTFTPRCSGLVTFGGFFSTRANLNGTARVEIHQGNDGPLGTLVGATNSVSLTEVISKTAPWAKVSFTATLAASRTYSFVVYMDNNLNFDNGFVTYVDHCLPDPCCPPWSLSTLEESLLPKSSDVSSPVVGAAFTLLFKPTAAVSGAMQAYINYLNLVNPAITQITIQFKLYDGGTGSTPVIGTQLGTSYYVTWSAGSTTGPFPPPTFFSDPAETLRIDHWYIVHTNIYLENGQTFFSDSCANNDVMVRPQSSLFYQGVGKPGGSTVLIMRDAAGRTVERQISQK